MNEYFIPRDGIAFEVITADISRYLGNHATVRPGLHKVRSSERADLFDNIPFTQNSS
jgi:hypothetical protein